MAIRIVETVRIFQSQVTVLYSKHQYNHLHGVRSGLEEGSKMAKKVSWMWGGKRYYGTLIRETKTHKFARTHNGKIKKIKK